MSILGTVNLRDWDEGCFKTLGAEIAHYPVDGETRAIYACDVPFLESGFTSIDNKVPCQFQDPEGVYQPYRLPCFQFRQNDLTPAFDRHSWYGWVARAPARDATKITLPSGQVGYDRYDNQWRATQFDITYDCMVLARRRQEALIMLQYALEHFISPWFIFKVVDSKGDVRQYDAGDITISNTSELADIAERTISYTISFTVRAEVDLHDIRNHAAMVEPHITYAQFDPSEVVDTQSEPFVKSVPRSVDLELLRDDFSATSFFVGRAPVGSAASEAVWEIRRFIELPGGDVEVYYADGSVAYDRVWDDRYEYTYGSEPGFVLDGFSGELVYDTETAELVTGDY